ncbi:Retrovirus-related Pol polyprotein from transposon TNT 1-94 [Nymphaea thermarum]|nr:Retrovirus-related Pol polyprotein from transposon TNT 1-94 [Nymphaea thermarum]
MDMHTYLKRIKFLADTLAAAGLDTDDSDLVQITMNDPIRHYHRLNIKLSLTLFEDAVEVEATLGVGKEVYSKDEEDNLLYGLNHSMNIRTTMQEMETGKVLLQGPKMRNGLYPIKTVRSNMEPFSKGAAFSCWFPVGVNTPSASFDLWHRRLGHANKKIPTLSSSYTILPPPRIGSSSSAMVSSSEHISLPVHEPAQPTSGEPIEDLTPTTTLASSSLDIPSSVVVTDVASTQDAPRLITCSMTSSLKPKVFSVIHEQEKPGTFKEAIRSTCWHQAMQLEFSALQKNKTWHLVPPQPDFNIIRSKWVYKIKRHPDGSIAWHKARLVSYGFLQETFSPTIKPTTIRVLLSLAVHFDWSLRQLDFDNAFLNGYLSEDVYMAQPEGFQDVNYPHHVCKLDKALYGLKQAPRAWYHHLSCFLRDIGFVAYQSDAFLFIYSRDDNHIFLYVYVDDLIITGSAPSLVSHIIKQLGFAFSIKNLGPLTYFLGIEVKRRPVEIYLSQRHYITDILHKAPMDSAKPTTSPMVVTKSVTVTEDLFWDPTMY